MNTNVSLSGEVVRKHRGCLMIMAGMAGGELLAANVTGSQLPAYAPAFEISRYKDPVYQEYLAEMDSTSGQL